MTTTDEQIAERLRAQVDALTPSSGVGLDEVRTAGRRRAARRRTGRAVAGVVAVIVTTAALALVPRDDVAAPAVPAARVDVVTADDLVRAFELAVEESGARLDGRPDAGPLEAGDPTQGAGWYLTWESGERMDRRYVQLGIFPDPSVEQGASMCDRSPEELGELIEVRACQVEELDDGGRLVSGEILGAFVHEDGEQRMWTPETALAYPDGRRITMAGGQAFVHGEDLPPGEGVHDWDGPVTLEQMREIVQRPEWTDVPLP